MEQWDVYDRNGNPTGRVKTRGEGFAPGEYHLGVSLWIVNRRRELLIQQRAPTKRIHPNLWGITGGAVIAGETSVQGCLREAREELGVDIAGERLVLLSRSFGRDCIYDDYIAMADFALENLTPQLHEVSGFQWATVDEIKALFTQGLFMMDDLADLEKVQRFLERWFLILPIS